MYIFPRYLVGMPAFQGILFYDLSPNLAIKQQTEKIKDQPIVLEIIYLEPSISPPFSKAAMSVLGFLSNDVFASPALSNRLNFVGTVRPSPRSRNKF